MLNQEGLVYVDKQYKNDMEEYEQIKKLTYKIVLENTPSASFISNWKNQIRTTLVNVRKQFDDWITDLSNKFVIRLNKIEQSKELIEFADTDKFVQS